MATSGFPIFDRSHKKVGNLRLSEENQAILEAMKYPFILRPKYKDGKFYELRFEWTPHPDADLPSIP